LTIRPADGVDGAGVRPPKKKTTTRTGPIVGEATKAEKSPKIPRTAMIRKKNEDHPNPPTAHESQSNCNGDEDASPLARKKRKETSVKMILNKGTPPTTEPKPTKKIKTTNQIQ